MIGFIVWKYFLIIFIHNHANLHFKSYQHEIHQKLIIDKKLRSALRLSDIFDNVLIKHSI